MATVAWALTTKARITERLANYNAQFDALIEHLIDEATDFIESQCNRRFAKSTFTNEKYNGYDSNGNLRRTIFVRYPIKTIASFQYKTQDNPETWANFNSVDYVVDFNNGTIRMVSGHFPGGWQNLRITYDAGYVVDFVTPANHELPYDLTMACNRLVIKEFKRRESAGRASEAIGGDSVNWIEDVDADIMRVIQKYQRLDFDDV